jgi:hypothetical protein
MEREGKTEPVQNTASWQSSFDSHEAREGMGKARSTAMSTQQRKDLPHLQNNVERAVNKGLFQTPFERRASEKLSRAHSR